MTQVQEKPEKNEARAKQHGEVFTPDPLVNEMLDKLPKEVWKEGKTFCDPACGDGQFLIWILLKKLSKGHDPLEALKTIYGVDIMRDSIRKCRLRLLKVISIFAGITEEHIAAVFQRIVWVNRKNHPSGSLEYEFEFENKVNWNDVDKWMKDIYRDHVLDDVELPVAEEDFRGKGREGSIFT